MDDIDYRSGVNSDATHTLSREDIKTLKSYAERFYQHYGVKLDVRIKNELWPPVFPKGVNTSTTIFIGLCPAKEQVITSFPPLVRNLLPKDFIEDIPHVFFAQSFENGTWPEGLAALLNALMKEFDKAVEDAVKHRSS